MSGATPGDGDTIAVFGEVHTGLVQHSTALPPATCQRLLTVFQGEPARVSERPIAHVVAPERLTGIDCRLVTTSGTSVRGIGTVATQVSITGGHVLQGCSIARLVRSPTGRRMPWAHYLARPGCIEVIGAADPEAVAAGFLALSAPGLDLSAATGRAADTVQGSAVLDRAPPLRTSRTMLRWAAVTVPEPRAAGPVRFAIDNAQRRTIRLDCAARHLAAAAEFGADVALHDWLLTTLLGQVQRSGIGTALRPDVALRLAPVVDHLLHLWMPAARTSEPAAALWDGLDRRPGLGRQWTSTVDRIRDQLALAIALRTPTRTTTTRQIATRKENAE
jgi:hypothetical protein